MEETLEQPTRMMDKKPEDLTVGESLKLNLGTIAVLAAAPVVFFGGLTAVDKVRTKFRTWRQNRIEAAEQEALKEVES